MEPKARPERRRWRLLALLVAAIVVAAACSGSGEEADGGDASADENGEAGGSAGNASTDPGDPADPENSSGAVACAGGTAEPKSVQPSGTIAAFFALCQSGDGALRPVFRPDTGYDPSASARLEQRIDALVDGTTDDERLGGLSTGFDQVAENPQIDVVAAVDGSGIATVEFLTDREPWRPGPLASSSAQLASFLDPLLAAAFADPEVVGVDLDGLCWGEMGCDAGITQRALWETILFTNQGVLSHANCDLLQAWLHPENCTLAGLVARPTVAARVVDVADDDTLNLRAGPGVDFPVVAEVAPNGEVAVTEAAAMSDDGGGWRLVVANDASGGGGGAASDDEAGWANDAFLSLTRTEAEVVVDAFVAFANERSNASFEELPLAADVDLGLGPDVLSTVPGEDLRRDGSWQFGAEEFRAYSGPFSALEALRSLNLYEVSAGAHPHCAADPVPAPSGYDDSDRISVQPQGDVITSCLEWVSIDFFLDGAGMVEAITLDLWEP